jgi:threonine aldolase
VDVLTLGTSKIGGGLGDAVIFFDPALARGFLHRMKQAGQVPAKTRFLAAPWNGLLESNVWARHAYHANSMAADLSVRLRDLGILPVYPRESNMVFVAFSEADRSALQAAGWVFHTSPDNGTSRLVCGWDATPAQNQAFIDTIVASRQ